MLSRVKSRRSDNRGDRTSGGRSGCKVMATPLADVMHEQKIDRPTTSKRSTYTDDRVVQKIDTLFVRLNQGTE